MRRALPPLLICALALLGPMRALADDAICTDRPTKSTGPCAAPQGHLQVEADLFDETYGREGGVTATTQIFASPTLKYGIARNLDLELNFTPYERQSVRSAGVTSTTSGFGDLYFKAKADLLAGKGAFDIGLAPYIKAPTASHNLGNGAVEAGLIVPMVYNLPDNWSVTVDPEIDALENGAGDGHHANAAALVSVGKGVGGGVTLSGELWSDVNWDPAGRVTQVSFDIGAAWIPASRSDIQLDGGFNFGLNRQTPDVQGYVGLSKRF
ncbi:transporter [Caulobacter sp. KR2-114]|uniref:transporter n=1 Tax=Caulobacter sp. KR2-114 TaxID=3400912 RepID=UPI003C086503